MLKLSDRDWKEFKIIDVLGNSHNAKPYHSDKLKQVSQREEKGLAYVTRTSLNNGLFAVVKEDNEFIKNPKDSISLGAENATYFYQPYKYITGNKMYYYSRAGMSKYILIFLTNCLNKAIMGCGFGYGMGLTGTRSDTRTFLLPIDSNGNPDYEFMEMYIKQIINTKRDEYRRFLNKQTNIKSLNSQKWHPFFISGENGVFHLRASLSGIDKNKLETCEKENVPYITRSDINNGVSLFVGAEQNNKYKEDIGNVITVGLDTQTAFYQPYNFFTGQNIQVLSSDNINKSKAMFIIPLLKAQLKKFNWGGNGATLGRLRRTKILLPVDINGNPDYEYMERYIENMFAQKYQRYLDFL